jgi:methanogenic corrinoid protein MtbC1
VIIVIQKQRRARKGLTSHRYRTVIGTISGGAPASEQKWKQSGRDSLASEGEEVGALVLIVVRCIAARAAGTAYELINK